MTTSAEAQQVDINAASAELQKAASDVISSATASGEDVKAAAGSKREAILNVANIIKDQASKGVDTSKAYLGKVIDQVGAYTAHAQEKGTLKLEGFQTLATTQFAGLQENFTKAVKAGQTSGTSTDRSLNATPASDGGSGASDTIKFPFNVVTWCSSVCGGKDGAPPTFAGRDISIEGLTAAATNLKSTLEAEAASASERAKGAVSSAQEQANAAVSKAKSAGQDAVQNATEQAQAAGTQAQQALGDQVSAVKDAAAAEQQTLTEQGEATREAALTTAGSIKAEVDAKVAELERQVSSAASSAAPAAPSF